VYFIPPILNDPQRRARYKDCVNWELAERYYHVGGVRIEDNVVVTTNGPVVLTKDIPKRPFYERWKRGSIVPGN